MNERVAAWGTRVFGSMAAFYLFALYGLLGALPRLAPYQPQLLFWSNWVQLWALPLLMVGGIVLNRASEKRANEDHETLMQELAEIKAMHEDLHVLMKGAQ